MPFSKEEFEQFWFNNGNYLVSKLYPEGAKQEPTPSLSVAKAVSVGDVQATEVQKESFLERMVREHNELNEKLIKLTEFKASNKYIELPMEDQLDLTSQHFFMVGYLEVLARRMKRHLDELPSG